MELEKLTNEELFLAYRNGNVEAFNLMARRVRGPIRNFVFSRLKHNSDTDDVTQEVLIRMLNNSHRFDFNKKLDPWMMTIAHRLTIDSVRETKKFQYVPICDEEGDMMSYFSSYSTYDEIPPFERYEDKPRVLELIKQLPREFRTIIRLVYMRRLTYNRSSKLLNIPMGTVKSRLHAAVQRFSELWFAQ